MSPTKMYELKLQHAAATNGVALIAGVERSRLEFTGNDRAKFLHNLCTNNVRDLAVGSGCETFILNVKGHTIGHGYIYAGATSHVFDTVAGQGEFLAAHFDRYLIREDVQIADRTAEWETLFLVGPQAAQIARPFWPEEAPNNTIPAKMAGLCMAGLCEVRKTDWFAVEAYQIALPSADRDQVREALKLNVTLAGPELFETLRIEHGTPQFGSDIGTDNLPQEIDRDGQAISFTKGCYLGQETVARIDALGHVNRVLRRIKFTGDQLPAVSEAMHVGEKGVGNLTSVCWSPRFKAPLALGYVKRGYEAPGTVVSCGEHAGEILPPRELAP